jgi:hypothetical protein
MSRRKFITRQSALLFLLLLTILFATFRGLSDRAPGILVWFAQSSAPQVLILTGDQALCDLAHERVKSFSENEKKELIPFFQEGLKWSYKDFEQRLAQPWWLKYLLIDSDFPPGAYSPSQTAMNCFDQLIGEMPPVGFQELFAKSIEAYETGQIGNRSWSKLWNQYATKSPLETARSIEQLFSQKVNFRIESFLLDLMALTGSHGLKWADGQMDSLSKYIQTAAKGVSPFTSGRLEGDFAKFERLVGYWANWGRTAPYLESERQFFKDYLHQKSAEQIIFIARYATNSEGISKEKLIDLVNALTPITEQVNEALVREAQNVLQSPSMLRAGGVELLLPQLRASIRKFVNADGKGLRGLQELEVLTRFFESIAQQNTATLTNDALIPSVEQFMKVFFQSTDPTLAISGRILGAILRGPFSAVVRPFLLRMLSDPKWRVTAMNAAIHIQLGFEPILKKVVGDFSTYSSEERRSAIQLVSTLVRSRPPYQPSEHLSSKELDSMFSLVIPENDSGFLSILNDFARNLGDLFVVYAKDKAQERPKKSGQQGAVGSVFIFYFLFNQASGPSEEVFNLFQNWLKRHKPACDSAYRSLFLTLRRYYPPEKVELLYASPEAKQCVSDPLQQLRNEQSADESGAE